MIEVRFGGEEGLLRKTSRLYPLINEANRAAAWSGLC